MSFGSYATNQSDWNFRKWLVPMLVLSLAFHLCLMLVFQAKKLREFAPVQTERLVPRVFNMKRAEVDPRILQNPDVPKVDTVATKPVPDKAKIDSPNPKKAFEKELAEVRIGPSAPEPTKLVNDNPKVDPSSVTAAINQMQERSAHALEREMAELSKQLTTQKPSSVNQPALTAEGLVDTSADPGDSPTDIAAKLKGTSAGPDVGMPGFSDIDQLLTQTGPLPSNTKPLNFRGDTLFSYDSFTLTEDAVSSMTKLGQLIQKNPEATFIIEGHSDSFGSPNYNLQLSISRAESVKSWLVQNMAIDPNRVQTRGYGSSKLLVPVIKNGRPTTVEEQQLNRRVEIVIRTK
ncbi:MAG TPA: OmpA family protein [Chthoniobacterales bacterium]|jgi:outer membrane protein OmpA-like peptidoglycan-associated protein